MCKKELSHLLLSGHSGVPRNTPEKNKHTNKNKHVTHPLPTYLNPEYHFTVGWEFFEISLPEDTLLNSKAPNHM